MGADRPLRPRHLVPGDTIAVVSPSWGGPSHFPHVFDHGLAVLRSWGFEVRESPTARASSDRLRLDPQARAGDLNRAFADPTVRAIVASIGGDDSIRLLPYLDRDAIAANPTILMGYSDTTTLLVAARRLGLVAHHGPSAMAGLSQMAALPATYERHVRELLTSTADAYRYPAFDGFVEGYPDWSDPTQVGEVGAWQPDTGPRTLQGAGVVTGELFGGCLDVLDWLRGTWAWPDPDDWTGRLLFLETSEEKPSPLQVERMLRAFGVAGVFDRVAGILVGRPRDHSVEERMAFEAAIRAIIAEEFGRPDLPIVAGLPFGHTDPQWVLPLGVRAELDVDSGSLRLVEPWLV